MIRVIHGELYSTDFTKLERLVTLHSSCMRYAYNQFYKYYKLHHGELNYTDEVRQTAKNMYPELNARQASDAVMVGQSIYTRFKDQKIIFGTKKTFRNRKNKSITHEQYVAERDDQIYSRGDKERSGNPNIRVVNDTIRVTCGFKEYEYYKLFIPLKYRKQFEELLISHQSYNVRLIRKNSTHFRVIIDYETPDIPIKIDFSNGVIGVDINPDRIALCEISNTGNYIKSFTDIDNRLLYASKNKKQYVMGCMIKKIIKYAQTTNKGIVFENLKFEQKYNRHETKWNKIKSNFSWKQILELLERKCIEYGIQYKKINPAFTSIIGKNKYQRLYNIPVHESAAYVIGRRGLGLKERLSIYGYNQSEVRRIILGTLAGKYKRKRLTNWALWGAVERHKAVLPGLLVDIDDLDELSDELLVHERDSHGLNLTEKTGHGKSLKVECRDKKVFRLKTGLK